MTDLSNMLNKIKDRTEEAMEHYANKEHWEPQDVKCAKEIAELYDKVQTIQMNTGIWENMKRSSDYSFARYPHMSYGHDESYARGRDGRYMSRGVYYDDRWHGGDYSYGDRHDEHPMPNVKDEAIHRLEQLMAGAKNDHERNEIMQMIKAVESQGR